MSVAPSASYTELCALAREAGTLGSVQALLAWDQETYMPHAGGSFRAEQQALVAGLVHERRTSSRMGELLAKCEGDPAVRGSEEIAANVREMRRDYDLATKLPKELVAELAKTASQSQEVWKAARANNDYATFAPWLEKMMTLSRRKADCLGGGKVAEPYDALLDQYEPGMTAKQIEAIFTPLRAQLTDLIKEVALSKKKVSTKCLEVKYDAAKQHALGMAVLKAIGFDLEAGRLDTTTHPFCEGLGPGDTRLTTRYREQHFSDALYGTLHEAGHGIYEQGLPKRDNNFALFGQPLADAISLGIHESQSRMWENFVGRSKQFWKWALPVAKKHLGKSVAKYDVKDYYTAVNTVKPSLIRVEADEGTYNMHIMIRFELERALIAGSLKVKDLPAEWNKRYKDYLGVDVPDDKRGCMQDVHWSFGLVGYFPTYTLGNLYCAQFWETIQEQIPDLSKQIAKGKFTPLREWLNTNIHRHGRRFRAEELCKRVTGKELSAEPLLRHLRGKAESVYGI